MGADGDGGHDGDNVQEQHYPKERFGQPSYAASLQTTPQKDWLQHHMAMPAVIRLQNKRAMPTAADGILGGNDRGRQKHQQRDDVSHRHAKEWSGKYDGSQGERQQ